MISSGTDGEDLDDQRQALVVRQRLEDAPHVLDERAQRDLLDLRLLLAGLHLGEVEHLVDEREQVLAGPVDRARVLDLLVGEVPACVLGEQARQQQHAVERRAQLVRHVGEELRLVGADGGELGGFLLEAHTRVVQLRISLLEHLSLRLQLLGLRRKLLVRLAELHSCCAWSSSLVWRSSSSWVASRVASSCVSRKSAPARARAAATSNAMASVSCTEESSWVDDSLHGWSVASSSTPMVLPSRASGSSTIARGALSPRPERMRR